MAYFHDNVRHYGRSINNGEHEELGDVNAALARALIAMREAVPRQASESRLSDNRARIVITNENGERQLIVLFLKSIGVER